MYDVTTIGSATRDVFLRSKSFRVEKDHHGSKTDQDMWLPLGSKLEIEKIVFETGGGATNAAVTFARQGLSTSVISKIGEDPGGKAIKEFLEDEGVSTQLIRSDPDNYTGYSIILVTNSGARIVLVHRGASENFSEQDIPWENLHTKWIFVTSLAGNVKLLKMIVDFAAEKGIRIALVPGSGELKKGVKVLSPIFSQSDVVVMNREEAATLTGIDPRKKEKIVHTMCLITRGVGVVTDAKDGATACDRRFIYHIGTHNNSAVERTGAGDAFASGFVAGLVKYDNVEGALELAADNASNVVNFFGAEKGIIYAGQAPFKDRLKISKTKVN